MAPAHTQVLRELAQQVDQYDRAFAALAVKRYWAIRRAHAAGMSYREIAKALNKSFQYVHWIATQPAPKVPT